MSEKPKAGSGNEVELLHTLFELVELVSAAPLVYVRYSEGSGFEVEGGSVDAESGLSLPGLSVNPLTPETWWTRPLMDWLARQLCQYKHLQDRNPERQAWVLRGRVIARGPDCEPLLIDVQPLARLHDQVLKEAQRVYKERFRVHSGPED
jgi:hypothetical protein